MRINSLISPPQIVEVEQGHTELNSDRVAYLSAQAALSHWRHQNIAEIACTAKSKRV